MGVRLRTIISTPWDYTIQRLEKQAERGRLSDQERWGLVALRSKAEGYREGYEAGRQEMIEHHEEWCQEDRGDPR